MMYHLWCSDLFMNLFSTNVHEPKQRQMYRLHVRLQKRLRRLNARPPKQRHLRLAKAEAETKAKAELDLAGADGSKTEDGSDSENENLDYMTA
jgi:hypothetical protein